MDSPGLDESALTAWFADHVPGAEPPLRFERLPGGRSNLSYQVVGADPALQWVLRRPPLGTALPTAHDMGREVVALRAMARTVVPVPAVVATCADREVTGAPFFVMEFVDGTVCRSPRDAERTLDVTARRTASLDLARVLATLHAVDAAAVGLQDFGRPDGYIRRQLGRWHAQWEADRTRVVEPIGRAYELLGANVPEQGRTSVVHGDYRLENCVLAPDGSVCAVLDWEISTLGDPRADLAMMLTYWGEAGDAVTALLDPPTKAPGFASRGELTEHYVAVAGEAARGSDPTAATAPTEDLDFFVAFSWWKIACIVEGVHTRMSRGELGETDRTAASFGDQAVLLADSALELSAAL
jgi:aminoglycoside phosphotransferase (APT) family kinase protein